VVLDYSSEYEYTIRITIRHRSEYEANIRYIPSYDLVSACAQCFDPFLYITIGHSRTTYTSPNVIDSCVIPQSTRFPASLRWYPLLCICLLSTPKSFSFIVLFIKIAYIHYTRGPLAPYSEERNKNTTKQTTAC